NDRKISPRPLCNAKRRVSTTLRQVFTKFSEVFICCQFSTRKFASGSPRNDDRQIDGPTACPFCFPMGAHCVFPNSIAAGSSVEAGLLIQTSQGGAGGLGALRT